MTDRLDRLEALMESFSSGLIELKSRTDSNAKSIEALANTIAEDRENNKKFLEVLRKDRAHVFEWMARLAAAQADFYEVQADYLQHVEAIDDRLTEILSRTTPPQS